jgi:tol-pal system protein YbgF
VKAGRVSHVLATGVLAIGLWASGALAQDYNQPPADVPDATDAQSEAGALALRLSRLEEALRRANGQIEELQNQNRKLADDFKRFRADVEFRLSGKSGQAGPLPAPSDVAAATPAPAPTRPPRAKNDAFDPGADPNAPGAPKPLGSTAPSAPLILSSHQQHDESPLKPLPTPGMEPKQAKADEGEPTFVPSGVPFSDSKEQFKAAIAAYKAGQYADAEAQFKAYLDANKGAANTPDAVFYIGETYMQRGRPREAAEQYLKVSTEYPKSRIAPESMVRLGLALAKLGNTEQACAAFAEVGKRYPTASATVKKSADREIAAHRCS